MIVFLGHKLSGVFVEIEEELQSGSEITLLQDNVRKITGFGRMLIGRRVCLNALLQNVRMQYEGADVPVYSIDFLAVETVRAKSSNRY